MGKFIDSRVGAVLPFLWGMLKGSFFAASCFQPGALNLTSPFDHTWVLTDNRLSRTFKDDLECAPWVLELHSHHLNVIGSWEINYLSPPVYRKQHLAMPAITSTLSGDDPNAYNGFAKRDNSAGDEPGKVLVF